METKEKRIEQLAAVIKQYEGLTQKVSQQMIDRDGGSIGRFYITIVNSEDLAAALVKEGFGNLRSYRQTLIELYLKGNTAELLKFIMEEV